MNRPDGSTARAATAAVQHAAQQQRQSHTLCHQVPRHSHTHPLSMVPSTSRKDSGPAAGPLPPALPLLWPGAGVSRKKATWGSKYHRHAGAGIPWMQGKGHACWVET